MKDVPSGGNNKVLNYFLGAVIFWIGANLSAITLFANLKKIISYADVIHVLLSKWNYFTHKLLSWFFGLFLIDLNPAWTPTITFMIFISMTVLGLKLLVALNQEQKFESPALSNYSGAMLSAYITGMMFFGSVILVFAQLVFTYINQDFGFLLIIAALGLILIGPTVLIIALSSRLMSVIIFTIMYCFTFILLAYIPLINMDWGQYVSDYSLDMNIIYSFISLPFLATALFTFALKQVPVDLLNKRFVFIIVGLFFLIGLNEIAKMELQQYL